MDEEPEIPTKKYKCYTSDENVPKATRLRRARETQQAQLGTAQQAEGRHIAEGLAEVIDEEVTAAVVQQVSDLEQVAALQQDSEQEQIAATQQDSDEDWPEESGDEMADEEASLFGSEISSEQDERELQDEAHAEDEPYPEQDHAEAVGDGGLNVFDMVILNEQIELEGNCRVGECVIMGTALADRYNLPDTVLEDIMKMFNTILGTEAVPSTTYLLKKTFQVPFNSATYYVYCVHCGNCLGKKAKSEKDSYVVCSNELCKKEGKLTLSQGNFFVMLDVQTQIKFILEGNPEISKFMIKMQAKDVGGTGTGVIRDNEDGIWHRTLFENDESLDRKRDVTYNFHVDGGIMFNTSKQSLYPIQLVINELPPGIRFRNIILAGLWYGKGPVMETFVEPFVRQAERLYEDGVTWTLTDGNEITSKFVPLCACADSVESPQLQNHTQFNGYFGCSWCYHPGELLPGTSVMKYPFMANLAVRKESELIRDMKEAVLKEGKKDRGKNGVLGVSPLLLLPTFNHVWGYAVDYLHQVLIGVFGNIVNCMLDSQSNCYLGRPKTVKSIDARIKSIRPPNTVPHTPKGLNEKGIWKVVDFKAFLLWYAIPCLHDVWKPQYIAHLACLVEGLNLLLQKEISSGDRILADQLLTRFVRETSDLYGPAAMSYNLHLLLHYVKSVEMCGPLWSICTFPYESKNYYFKKNVTGSKGVALQITERDLPGLNNSVNPSDRVKSFVKKITSSPSQRFSEQKSREVDGTLLFGNGWFRQLNETEADILGVGEACEYSKVLHNGLLLTSTSYQRSGKRCNSYVKLLNGGFGELSGVFVIDDPITGVPYCKYILRILQGQRMKCGEIVLSNVWKCNMDSNSFLAVDPHEVTETCILINFKKAKIKSFIVMLPNSFEDS